MGYYPIFVEMEARRVLLVGGGAVAHEKIGKLVDVDADITVLATEVSPPVREYIESGRARLLQRDYRPGDVQGFEMIMIAADDGAVNQQIADEARAAGIWVNAADDVANCDFILPAMVRRGNIAIATSTAGASPALARWLRERMEDFLTDEVVMLGDLVSEVRQLARLRDHECAAGCELVRTPPPLLCTACPNRIPADRWQEVIEDERRALLDASEQLSRAQDRDGEPEGSLLALLRRGEYRRSKQRMIEALGVDRPLLARATP